jgi:hypothetical protein
MSKLLRVLALLSLFVVVVGARAVADEASWQFVSQKEGVHVWKHEVAGSDMPAFRGQVFLKASIDQILNQMLDWKRHTEWMYGCQESTLLQVLSPEHAIMYNRVGSPWPVWDRDVIADTQLERSPDGKALVVNFKNVDSKLRPVPRGVIRLPRLIGFYKLWQLEPKRTQVLYQVEMDAGGSLPRWLASYGAEALPYETLSRLRKRVERPD